MLLKAAVIGCALVSTPILATNLQSPQGRQQPAADADAPSTPEVTLRDAPPVGDQAVAADLRAEVARLRAELKEAKDAAERARTESTRTQAELKDALDLIVASTDNSRRGHHNCTPSRSRSLLTYYQWMDERGHKEHADTMIARVIKETGRNTEQLNSLAWHLMTEKSTQGKFDRAALAVAKAMEKHGHMRHHHADTLALALFLNGDVDAAVKHQRAALKESDSGDYRRRLRVYEAALANRQKSEPSSAVAGG